VNYISRVEPLHIAAKLSPPRKGDDDRATCISIDRTGGRREAWQFFTTTTAKDVTLHLTHGGLAN
jgi:hypothetical protein